MKCLLRAITEIRPIIRKAELFVRKRKILFYGTTGQQYYYNTIGISVQKFPNKRYVSTEELNPFSKLPITSGNF